MTLYRPHRGHLADSMKEVVMFHGRSELIKIMRAGVDWYPPDKLPTVENTKVEAYGGVDKRIGWDTYIVTVNGSAWGFTNGPVD